MHNGCPSVSFVPFAGLPSSRETFLFSWPPPASEGTLSINVPVALPRITRACPFLVFLLPPAGLFPPVSIFPWNAGQSSQGSPIPTDLYIWTFLQNSPLRKKSRSFALVPSSLPLFFVSWQSFSPLKLSHPHHHNPNPGNLPGENRPIRPHGANFDVPLFLFFPLLGLFIPALFFFFLDLTFLSLSPFSFGLSLVVLVSFAVRGRALPRR